ncbi:kunitz-type protease inhibitor 1-like [Astyanax mexicanus]|uniref:Kunitz-type protease inhibitor 1-like n=1 Tax=Astyanax mexicanus TaxID=7994 RepID=A0A8B9LIT4_ASTMX|nr:kunitz-type protease inhibitor 1-like [Astyanax mexicanus]
MAVLGGGARLLLLVVLLVRVGVSRQDSCTELFTEGRADFAVNAEDSVQDGATYLSNPAALTVEDCVSACCRNARCNLALVERAEEQDSITNCFLFDCVYRNKYVCRFVKTTGFSNYIRTTVYDHHLGGPPGAGEEDRQPIANAGPDEVVRPGQKVTLNGIESWDDKKIVSYEWKQTKGNTSVLIEKAKYSDQRVLSNLYPGFYEFQLKVTDSAGQSDSTSVTVLVLTAEQAEQHCLTPKKVGPCRGAFPRWHYNAASNKCEEFTFGGCLENGNNYLSSDDCVDACNGTIVMPGARKVMPITEDCDGSDEENCQRLNRTLSRLLQIPVNEGKARCVDPPVTGPCRASFTRWYYDPLQQDCHRFTYGGCTGNKNNFEGQDKCMDACRDVTEKDVFARGQFERSEQEDHHSGSVGTAVVLVVVILALLALLGFFLLKKRKSRAQHQPVPTANPAINLADDTENLVYKPTTTSS